MRIFEIKSVQGLLGKRPKYYRLLIDNECVIKTFKAGMEGALRDDLGSIFAVMERAANAEKLPKQLFRPLKSIHADAFEVKTGLIRFYGMVYPPHGNLIIKCSYKATQPEDLKGLKALIKEIKLQSPPLTD